MGAHWKVNGILFCLLSSFSSSSSSSTTATIGVGGPSSGDDDESFALTVTPLAIIMSHMTRYIYRERDKRPD
jgi:hypothetical protein